MSAQSSDYWLGSLAMTVALAANDPYPRPLLKTALKEFLADHGPDHPLGAYIRESLKGRA